MNYDEEFAKKLQQLKKERRYRYFINLERMMGEDPYALWRPDDPTLSPKKVLVWCSNDYMGMSHHPDVVRAMIESTLSYGLSSDHFTESHEALEQTIADHHGKEKALALASGYNANEAALSALARALPGCVILSDAKNHASIIQGIRLGGGAKEVFQHNDMADLESLLSSYPLETPKIIVVVSVYSMDGDLARLKDVCDLAEKYNALTYLDEVHAVGIYGEKGEGMAAFLGLSDRVDIIQGNFAKAYGVIGGYIAADASIIDLLRVTSDIYNHMPPFPPCVAEAARQSILTLQSATHLREKLWERVRRLKQGLSLSGVPYLDGGSHIVPVMVCDAQKCRDVSRLLLEDYSIYLQPINFPTVPRGTERLRLTVTPLHTFEMIDQIIEALGEIWGRLALKRAA